RTWETQGEAGASSMRPPPARLLERDNLNSFNVPRVSDRLPHPVPVRGVPKAPGLRRFLAEMVSFPTTADVSLLWFVNIHFPLFTRQVHTITGAVPVIVTPPPRNHSQTFSLVQVVRITTSYASTRSLINSSSNSTAPSRNWGSSFSIFQPPIDFLGPPIGGIIPMHHHAREGRVTPGSNLVSSIPPG